MSTSCLGGWCQSRDTCRYHLNTTGIPIERLCEPGQHDAYQRVSFVRPAPSIHTHPQIEAQPA